ncbi:MAG: hypothetical protein H0W58_08900 [Acidobacteria bacterium]|nr:hypothetical protein [Acidobacteriota bacterium]
MTPQEILNEIYKLPLPEQKQIADSVLKNRAENNYSKPKMTEEEFLQYLLAKGVISEIPEGITDEEDDFEPLEIEGEPLSETIIRERR